MFLPCAHGTYTSVAVETAENIAALKLITEGGSYKLFWGSFNSNLTFIFDLNYFLWKLKRQRDKEEDLCLKANKKFPYLKRNKFLECQFKTIKSNCLIATSLKILVVNTQYSVALANSWLQFQIQHVG